ncbi:MAG: toll/interleukin-1 receptor domain-containing protein [Alphaproteobacteria bacterium]|nr:toll/interleukin-1 receptor domain-containing protein [Alphaproteobacteria bacterium]
MGADLSEFSLDEINLEGADLTRANLQGAILRRANFRGASLYLANLANANLVGAHFESALLRETNLFQAILNRTVLLDVDLSKAKSLDTCIHVGPSGVDYRTIQKSEGTPQVFWRDCGLPDALIDYMPSLTGNGIRFYSCFISYSSKDQDFADRLHADLQSRGVRCWFAPHDLPIGEKILDGIDDAIRLREKVVLILSEGAIGSGWVEDEVATAFEEERIREQNVLFPVRLDDAVLGANEAWASKLRARNIGDFTRGKDHDAYHATFKRVLRDLSVEL